VVRAAHHQRHHRGAHQRTEQPTDTDDPGAMSMVAMISIGML
jgi:hypothetical protein